MILRSRHMPGYDLQDCDPGTAKDEQNDILVLKNDLTLLIYTMDIQTTSYVLDKPPDLPPLNSALTACDHSNMKSVKDAWLLLVPLLHSCYHFTAHASQYKYLPRHAISQDIFVEQGRHIAQLSLWLAKLDHDILSPRARNVSNLAVHSYTHALMLRILCVSTMIYASTVLSPYETVYDNHASSFQQIVTDVTAVLGTTPKSPTDLGQFRPGPGIIQPLFFTAMKYRHSQWRRLAIDVLKRAGRERPFDGVPLASVATRAVQIEEAASATVGLKEPLPNDITEQIRLHGCGMAVEAKDKPANTVTAMFSQCRDVETMLSSNAFGNSSNWNIWYEDLCSPHPCEGPFHRRVNGHSPFPGLTPKDRDDYAVVVAKFRAPQGASWLFT